MMPKICSHGYRFPLAVCKTRKLRGFIFLTHHTKTMSCRIVVSDWEDWGWAHPLILRPPSEDRIVLQVEKHITLVSNKRSLLFSKASACVLVAEITVCQCYISGLFWPNRASGFWQDTVLDICDGSGRTKQLFPVSSKYQHIVILSMETLVINGVAELSTF